MRRTRPGSWVEARRLAGVAACAMAAWGCAPTCDTTDVGNPAVRYTGGTTTGDAHPTYASSPWDGPFLHFPGGRRYEIVHKLGFAPTLVQVYLAFTERGTGSGNVAPSAGNAAVIQSVTDSVIVVKNDSCADYWLRVVASGEPGVAPVDAGGQ